jgi:hypothetical protein
MGRTSKLTEELQARITHLVALGLDELTAFTAEGVSRSSFYEWRRLARAGEEPFASLWYEVERAAAKRNTELTLGLIKAARAGDVNTAFKLLKAFRPDLYGDKARIEHTGADGRPIETLNASLVLSDEAADQLMRKALLGERDREALEPCEAEDTAQGCAVVPLHRGD